MSRVSTPPPIIPPNLADPTGFATVELCPADPRHFLETAINNPMNIRLLSIVSMLASSVIAGAQDVSQFFTTHNTIAFGDANLKIEQEGRVLVGDVLVIQQSMQFGFNTTIPNSDYAVAAGTILSNGNHANVNQGSVLSATGFNGNFNMNSGGQKISGQEAYDANLASYGFSSMSQIKSEFEVLSDYLASLPTTGTFIGTDQNKYQFIGNNSSDSLSVINITSEQLASARGLEISVPNSGLLVINVSGTDPTFNGNFMGSSSNYATNILWNFPDATSITANRRIEGSGLAPNATVTFNDGYQGSWVVDNVASIGGEAHFRPLAGSLPKPPSSKVPEGGPGLVLLGALAAALGMLRKRKA